MADVLVLPVLQVRGDGVDGVEVERAPVKSVLMRVHQDNQSFILLPCPCLGENGTGGRGKKGNNKGYPG